DQRPMSRPIPARAASTAGQRSGAHPPGGARAWLGGLLSLAALALAVSAAIATGTAAGGPVGFVERLSGASTTLPPAIAAGLPAGYAFGAGMVAAVNPCGFALLPAYLGLYLAAEGRPGGWRAIPRALAVSSVVALSFVLLFGTVGLVLSAATSAVAGYFPWAGLGVGVLLVLAGGRVFAGRALSRSFANRLPARVGAG